MSEASSQEPVKVPLVTEVWGLYRSFRAARRNLLEIIPEIATRQPMVSGKTGKRWHMVMDPGANRRILNERLDDYPKSDVTRNILRPAIGESLFIAEGAHWRWQRRAAAPVFSHRNVQNLGPVMTRAAEACSTRIAENVGRVSDMYREMIRVTFEVISDVIFTDEEGFDRDAMHRAIDAYIDRTARVSFMDIAGVPDWIPRPGRILSSKSLTRMKRAADSAIDTRRGKSASRGPPNLLGLLLESGDRETGRSMTTAELRDNLLTFIVAGHETTALTLSWALYLCAFDPGVQERARTEAKGLLNDRAATAQDCDRLPFVRQIIDEALRLYPPAAMLSRTARVPDEILGRKIRSGDTVILPIYALHRNRLLWEDPDAFRPCRFSDPSAIDRYAYLPFGHGPRVCIGASFAVQEAVIILATLLSRYRFSRVPGKEPKPVMILTLRPQGGVWLHVDKL